MRRVALAAAVVVVPLAAPVEPQEAAVRFGQLGTEQGLSSNWVLAVLRDRRGFLWVGTEDGLNRYDGRSVVTYDASSEPPHRLPFAVAGVLFEDSRGRLWVGSRWGTEGMAWYDSERDRFVRLAGGAGSGGLSDARVNAIAEDRDGRLWVGTRKGLERVDPDRGRSERFGFARLEEGRGPPRMVESLLRSRAGTLWVGTTSGLFVFDRKLGRCVPWVGPGGTAAQALREARVEALVEDAAGVIWAGTISDGLFAIDPEPPSLRHYLTDPDDPTSLSRDRVRCLALDGAGHLWVGTENGGLNLLDRRTDRFRRLLPNALQPHALGSASIYALQSDDQGILWVGTYNAGLNYIAPSEQRFDLVTARHDGLRDSHVSALLEDRAGNLWVGTDAGGLARIDGRTGGYTSITHDERDPHSIGSDSVLTLVEDEAGMIWLGGWDGGVSRLDPATGQARRYRHDPANPASIVGDDVWRLRRLPTGELLVATQQGADLLDPSTGIFTRLASRFRGVEPSMTLSLDVTDRGDFWIGQSGRAQHVAVASGEVTTYQHSDEKPSDFPRGMVFAILEDSGGNTWFGTERGLLCLPAARQLGDDLVRVDGLPHPTVTNVIEDSSGSIWVSTGRGLTRLGDAVRHPEQPTMVNFDVNDGLQGSEFTRGAAMRDREGRLYVGGPRGFNVFRPESIRLNTTPPPVVLTDLRVFNRSAVPGVAGSPLMRAALQTRSLTLTQDQFVLTFQFAALNLDLPGKNRYAYKLEGLESDWNDVGVRREATYTQLRPGHYVLRVRASNNDGVWNQEGLSLDVTVLPRWYERWVTRVFFVGLGTLLVAAGFRRRVRQLEAREHELSRRVDDRTRALNQLNEELEQRVGARTLELQEEKERLAVTLRSIGDGVIATDVQSRVALLNRVAEQITGWSALEAQGRPLQEVLPVVDPSSRMPQQDPVERLLVGESARAMPIQGLLVRADGVERTLSQSVAPIRDHLSRTVGAVLVVRDVTDERKVEQQLQNSQKLEALGILAGGIAHDFNNLLTGVFGYLDVTRRRWVGRPEEVETLDKALAVLERARGLTGQLLTFSRGGEPVTAPLDLGDLLRRSVDFALSGSNVVGELHISDQLWACEGDRRQIDQVVDNLLLNARQAMPNGGTIRVAAENVVVTEEMRLAIAAGRYVRIAVQDNGVGIPPEVRSRIFEPFFSTKTEGTGLGLATSYSIVRKHGGHIDVSSEPGHGTRFVVYLPASDRVVERAGAREKGAATARCRVLVMDDEDYVRDVAREMLEELGHTVQTAADADGAMAVFAAAHAAGQPFDLVMLDLTIPGGLGGLAVLARIKQIDPQVRAVASSGYSGDPAMADPMRHGFVAQLTKPYTVADLSDVISRALSPPEDGAS